MESIYPYRHSTRLRAFDYGQTAAYFVSVVVEDRQHMFGRIVDKIVQLSKAGEIVRDEWLATSWIRPGIYLDESVVMPDHFQAILFMDMEIHRDNGDVGAHRCAPVNPFQRQPRTLGSLIAQFKATTTRKINEIRGTKGQKVWQRNYHDRIIRNEVELDKVRKYIRNNPREAKYQSK
jgi:putative transposase